MNLKSVSGHLNPCYGAGATKVWYTRPEFGRDFRMGAEWLTEQGQFPHPSRIDRTHVAVGCVSLHDLDEVYHAMQGERWSPQGEAREFIASLGLAHTSMSVGDIIQTGSTFWMVDSSGFVGLGCANTMRKGEIIRDANGGDWSLWRIEETYEADSPYVFAVLVSNHKFHKAGMEKRMIRKSGYRVEPDPEAFAKSHHFTVDLNVTLHPQASWT